MKLDDWMIDNGHDDESLGALIGVSRITVSRWRRGKRLPAGLNVARVSRVTGGAVRYEDFLSEELTQTSRGNSGPDTRLPSKAVASAQG